jgi:hypothetical protein
MNKDLKLEILRQPDGTTCGPTCLHAVYRYFDDDIELSEVIREVAELPTGGTLSVMLAIHALKRGYKTILFTYNLNVFDPTWFVGSVDLAERLIAQAKARNDPKLHIATRAYLEYLNQGGAIIFEDLSSALFHRYLDRGVPILTGLSATYLYRQARERAWDDEYDDTHGQSAGHFVVLSGYDEKSRELMVVDPLFAQAMKSKSEYTVKVNRLVCAILLGILSYDGNLLVIEPSEGKK